MGSIIGVSPGMALASAEHYNEIDYWRGNSQTITNQTNHNEAIIRGYLNNSSGVSNDTFLDKQVIQYTPITNSF
jgi:hypothetical protein